MAFASAVIYASRLLFKRRACAETLEKTVEMINFIESKMRFSRPAVDELIGDLLGDSRFSGLEFLRECDEKIKRGSDFHSAWRQSVEHYSGYLSDDNIRRLCSFGDCLGTTDSEGQLSACSLYCSAFKAELEREKEKYLCAKKLYPALGTLAGTAAAVMVL